MKISIKLKNVIFWIGITAACVIAAVFLAPIGYQLLTHVDHKLKTSHYKVKTDIELITTQLDGYYKSNGSFPNKLVKLVTEEQENQKSWSLKKLPKDPWGVPYQYTVESVNDTVNYKIWTYGNDGKLGGEGENSDLSNSTNWKIILD